MYSKFTLLTLLPAFASAHFQILWPVARGFDEQGTVNGPCGGFNDAGSKGRTLWPITGGPIQLNMEHTEARTQVNIALGNNPGDSADAFNINLVPTVQERGPNSFCLGDVMIPASLNITSGMNATLQVITNGDPDGGLYNVRTAALHTRYCHIPFRRANG